MFSSYANKKTVDVEDIRLAIQLQVERRFTSPTPRDLLAEIARQKNSQPLPSIRSHTGLRLPPDRYSLVACNYRLKSANKLKSMQVQQQQQQANPPQPQIIQIGSQFTLPIQTFRTNTGSITLTNLPTKTGNMITIPTAARTATPKLITIPSNLRTVNNPLSVSGNDKPEGSSDDVGMDESSQGTKRKLDESGVAVIN